MVAPGGESVANTTVNFVVGIITLGLCIKQWFIDSEFDDNGELVFIDFCMVAKSASCFKQFITAYHAFRTMGMGLSEMSGFVCLLGFFLHSYAITITLNRTYRAWARTTIVCAATLLAAGISLLCLGMFIPKDHAWNTTVVPVIIILTVLFDVALLVLDQRNQSGEDQHLLRDLVMKSVEVSITVYRWVDSIRQTRNPWNAEKILNLVGSSLPVLIGAWQIGLIMYKMGIPSKVVEWLRRTRGVSAMEEEQSSKSAMAVDEDGDMEEQAEKEGVEIVVAPIFNTAGENTDEQ